jgi:hypothetical protein
MTVASTEETRTITEIERTESGKEILDHNPFGVPKAAPSPFQRGEPKMRRPSGFKGATASLAPFVLAPFVLLEYLWVGRWPLVSSGKLFPALPTSGATGR